MTNYREYLKPENLSRLSGLELKARMIVEGYVSGMHKSPFHGFSAEFAEHREYVPGDDLRYVDWKVFGKSDRYYLKQFEEETNFSCHILLDASESMKYKSSDVAVSKFEYARYIAAALAYLIVQQQDAVGLVTFDKTIREFVPPSSRASHLKNLIHIMDITSATGESSIGTIFHQLAEQIKHRGLVIILSDLFDNLDELERGLKHFRYRKMDVSVLHIIDPAEQDFPFDSPTLFKGLEVTLEQMAEPRSLRKAYQKEFEQFLQQTRGICRTLQMEHQLIRTDQPLDIAISSYLNHRMQRLYTQL